MSRSNQRGRRSPADRSPDDDRVVATDPESDLRSKSRSGQSARSAAGKSGSRRSCIDSDRRPDPLNQKPPTLPRLDTPPTPPGRHPTPRHPRRLTNRAPMLPPLRPRHLRPQRRRHLRLRNPHPRRITRRLHERAPFRPMRPNARHPAPARTLFRARARVPARTIAWRREPSEPRKPRADLRERSRRPTPVARSLHRRAALERTPCPGTGEMHRRMRRLMTEHLVEERANGRIEEPCSDRDLLAGGAVAPERAAHSAARAHADALREQRRLPEHGPGFEAGMERFEGSRFELGHKNLDSTPACTGRSAAREFQRATRAALLIGARACGAGRAGVRRARFAARLRARSLRGRGSRA